MLADSVHGGGFLEYLIRFRFAYPKHHMPTNHSHLRCTYTMNKLPSKIFLEKLLEYSNNVFEISHGVFGHAAYAFSIEKEEGLLFLIGTSHEVVKQLGIPLHRATPFLDIPGVLVPNTVPLCGHGARLPKLRFGIITYFEDVRSIHDFNNFCETYLKITIDALHLADEQMFRENICLDTIEQDVYEEDGEFQIPGFKGVREYFDQRAEGVNIQFTSFSPIKGVLKL